MDEATRPVLRTPTPPRERLHILSNAPSQNGTLSTPEVFAFTSSQSIGVLRTPTKVGQPQCGAIRGVGLWYGPSLSGGLTFDHLCRLLHCSWFSASFRIHDVFGEVKIIRCNHPGSSLESTKFCIMNGGTPHRLDGQHQQEMVLCEEFCAECPNILPSLDHTGTN